MAAAVTRTITLATGIMLVTERHPLLLATAIAVLDHYSHGRFLCGVGAGWHREETMIMGATSITGGPRPGKQCWR
jgi:alkanesulfonate monooxygenase SsuD/methylene tetrahydromethanopterin reductase-like flavin-dependent oxidoreductase (luciferase family)